MSSETEEPEPEEPYKANEWPTFSHVVSRIWQRLKHATPTTAKETKTNRNGSNPETPPWVEERIKRYAARVASGKPIIFDDPPDRFDDT